MYSTQLTKTRRLISQVNGLSSEVNLNSFVSLFSVLNEVRRPNLPKITVMRFKTDGCQGISWRIIMENVMLKENKSLSYDLLYAHLDLGH